MALSRAHRREDHAQHHDERADRERGLDGHRAGVAAQKAVVSARCTICVRPPTMFSPVTTW